MEIGVCWFGAVLGTSSSMATAATGAVSAAGVSAVEREKRLFNKVEKTSAS